MTLTFGDAVAHAVNHPFWISDDGFWIWSAHATQLVIAGILTIWVLMWVAKNVATGPKNLGAEAYVTRNPIAHLFEVICVYLRDEIVRPLLGKRTDKLMPFLWSLFFFILFNNILGLIPILDLVNLFAPDAWTAHHLAPVGGTATQNLFVTGVLALFAFIFINFHGIKELGVVEYFKHMTGGVPLKWYFAPIVLVVFVIELVGVFLKPIALAIRLFANMTAGHILLATLLSFTAAGFAAGLNFFGSAGVLTISAFGAFAVYFIEILVAFLQAFIFMFLTAVFTSLLAHHEEHEHDEEHHAPAGTALPESVSGPDMEAAPAVA